MNTYIKKELEDSAEIIKNLLIDDIETIAKVFVDALSRGNKIIFMGNGGSMADAQHLAAELLGKFEKDRKPLDVLALDNLSAITAIANDFDFSEVFARQLEGYVNPGDVVVAISTSGESKNILEGIAAAEEHGAVIVGFTRNGSELDEASAFSLSVPSDRTCRIQEAYMVAGHIICEMVEKEMVIRERYK